MTALLGTVPCRSQATRSRAADAGLTDSCGIGALAATADIVATVEEMLEALLR